MTSPACPYPRAGRRAHRGWRAAAASVLGLALLAGPTAAADELFDRHGELRRQIAAARGEVEQQSAELARATDALAASQRQLAEAQDALAGTRRQLEEARTLDAELATTLAAEQRRLAGARAAVARARAEVRDQQALMARAARDAYQKRTDLAVIPAILGSRTPQEVQQRLQWDTTIFDTTSAQLSRLEVLRQQHQEAEARQAAIEAAVAAERRRAAENVERIAALERSAAQLEADVVALVAHHETYRADAERALAEDTARYEALLADEAGVEAEIASRVRDQLANGAPREDIARLVAMGVVSTDPATYPLAATGAQMILSPQGFIRPLKARPGSPFGPRFHPILKYWRQHNGTDYGAACGVPLYAAQSGTVVQAREQGGFGLYTIIDHGVVGGHSIMTGYAHQSSMVVRAGQRVQLGDLLGYVGTTGLSTGCHLHLQVYRDGKPVDPLTYIP